MKAIAYVDCLPIEDDRSLFDIECAVPEPGERDLLVRIEAVAVNPRDVKSRRTLRGTPQQPMIIGYDASGVVEKVGRGVTLFEPGDEVFYAGVTDRPGSNAQFQLVDERIVGHKPVSLDHATAASLPLTSLTAYEMLFDRLEVPRMASPRRSVLILGGAGGVPSMAIQLARGAGLTVIATASRPESAAWVRELGADHVIDHRQPLDAQIQALGQGTVDYVFSSYTSARAWAEIARVITPQGRFGLIDDPEPLDLRLYKPKSVSIHWEAMFTRPMQNTPDMARQHDILDEVARQVDAGELRATATRNLGAINAANLRAAHALIESGRTIGKIVLAGF
ncbi:zinc-binding alcohol dehydrogenase family protein [Castellaniella sp. GW247-6E4]|uniref:zinc-binding alcohol dehydrogenase family protein n=1 Tax=Castellaniella sp. GW247-6E4 TaxID=3140380 RepID=UPI0033162BEA